MAPKITPEEAALRRDKILQAARWCFLNFGYSKTSLDDIAKRAGISRTLLYKTFNDKEDIFTAVFQHWLVSRHPQAREAVQAVGTPQERLFEVCRVMMIEPWADMIGAPMAGEFFEVCERVDPEIDALHRHVALASIAAILDDDKAAEVFLLSLDGLIGDEPAVPVLEQRVRLLIDRFV
ncbi:TetR family transcriptional regulator (plasmid) [Sinorhizobium americanum CCGM7]|uniref:TetR/AcrR family transcriptional regulator n=1 Tax=Sinorhizobium americanum TaxID=194963 RepID=UPI0004D49BA3|nr:TetR/AcrR family transcriptional regulator [Sinorhizobium americanum]APG86574.1 TetR family transcriptional regulator [Sinorhizobium americanum CCGM7]